MTMITCLILWIPAGTTYEPDGPPLTSSTAPGEEDGKEDDEEDGEVDDEEEDGDDPEQPAATTQMAAPAHSRPRNRGR